MPARSTLYVRRERERLLQEYGACCKSCGGTDQLEFAHEKLTEIWGLGRGSYSRIKDVKDHPDAYTLLCQPCHKVKDGPLWRNPSDEYRRQKQRASRRRYNVKRKAQRRQERLERDGKPEESERRSKSGRENESSDSERSERERRPTKKRSGYESGGSPTGNT